MATLRHARPEDASAIAGIWNPVIETSLATFNSVPRSAADVAAMIAARSAAGHVWLVAEDGDGLAGFATYAQFRAGIGYAFTMEHSIILAPSALRRGLGSALMTRLEDEARGRGVRSLIGGISGANAAGIAFHARRGFVTVGRLEAVGHKAGRWLDLVLVQKRL